MMLLLKRLQLSFNLGSALQLMSQYQEALKVLNEALKFDPNKAEAYNQKEGIVFESIDKNSEALIFYEQAIKLGPQVEYYYENKGFNLFFILLADLLEKLERYPEAIIQYEQLIKLNPQNSEHFIKKSLIQQKLGSLDQSIVTLKEGLQLNPKNADLYNELGLAYDQQKQYNEAIRMFDAAIELDNNNSDYYLNKGQLLYDNNQFLKALDDLESAIQLDPKLMRHYSIKVNFTILLKGKAYHKLQQYKEAVLMYDKAISIDSENAEYYFKKGKSLEELQEYQDARQAYNQSLKLDPNDEVYNCKGVMFQKMGNHQAAIQMFDKAINLNSNEPIFYFNKAQSFKNTDDYDNAVIMYNQAIKFDPEDHQFYSNKGINFKIVQSILLVQNGQISVCKASLLKACENQSNQCQLCKQMDKQMQQIIESRVIYKVNIYEFSIIQLPFKIVYQGNLNTIFIFYNIQNLIILFFQLIQGNQQ
ncbi:hypothetical protein pb186bvf_002154 [Paramecium bursaria]